MEITGTRRIPRKWKPILWGAREDYTRGGKKITRNFRGNEEMKTHSVNAAPPAANLNPSATSLF